MKKVLSWVLVLALVLSSFTMAFAGDTANSSEMKDAAAIQNVEAVDVMVATGIIGGYPDGYYYPEKAVTRAEMAKMISVAVNGGEDVGAYYANSCTFADSVNHWAAGYIAYCANEGIIDGRDANTFDPDANVTGVEAAKMMLVALGYDSKIEKMTGDQWSANVLKLAKNKELFEGCDDFNAGAALDRDNAAQIIFNGLQAVGVEYKYDAEISTGDTTVTVNTKAEPTKALYLDAFDNDLKTTPVPADKLGRPGHDWTLDGDEIGTYADTAKYEFVAAEVNTVEKALKDYDEDLYDEFDGVKKSLENSGATVKLGDTVEIYDVDDPATTTKTEYKAVVISYTLGQISEVDTIVSDADAKDGVAAYVTVDAIDCKDTKFAGYDADAYVKDAVIAYVSNGQTALAKSEIYASFVPEKVTGEVTKLYSDSVYVDGTAYPLVNTGLVEIDGALAVEKTYDFYLVNGYVYGTVLVEENSTTLYGIFTKGGSQNDAYGSKTTYAKIVAEDGVETEYIVDADYVDAAVNKYSKPSNNSLVAYTVNEDGEIDSLKATVKTVNAGDKKSVSSKGIFDATVVSKNVVVFNDDNNDLSDPAWAVYGYDEFAAAEEGIACDYMTNDDGDIIAVYTKSGTLVSTTSTVIGFVTDVKDWTGANSKTYHDITLLVNGEAKTYTTVKDIAGYMAPADNSIVVLTINADNEITALGAGTVDATVSAPVSEFADGKDFYAYKGNAWNSFGAIVYDINNGYIKLDLGGSKYENHYANAAVVYEMTADGIEKSSVSKIKDGYQVEFYQFDEASDAWDAIVFKVF